METDGMEMKESNGKRRQKSDNKNRRTDKRQQKQVELALHTQHPLPIPALVRVFPTPFWPPLLFSVKIKQR